MKNLNEMLNEVTETPISLTDGISFTKFLTEESEYNDNKINEADDPFGGDDAGGDSDPFGSDDSGSDDLGGDDLGSGDDESSNEMNDDSGDEETTESTSTDENPSLTDDSHEDDPDFNIGKVNNSDVTLMDVPAAKSIYDIENIMDTVKTVIQTLSEDQLVEIEKVKNCIELIFNGKKLNEEDLEFNNIKNAIFLIKKICSKLDTKTKMYLNRKLKEPLIKKRDTIKQQIAAQKGELENARDVLVSLDIK